MPHRPVKKKGGGRRTSKKKKVAKPAKKARKANHRRGDGTFEKGQSGNPAGRPPLTPELRKLRELNKENFERLIHEFMASDFYEVELMACALTPCSTIERTIAKYIVKYGYRPEGLSMLLDRLLGPIVKKHQHSGDEGNPIAVKFTAEERKQKLAQLAQHLAITAEDDPEDDAK